MTNDQFKSTMIALKNATGSVLNACKDVFNTLDDDIAKKYEMNIADVIYSLSRAYEDVDMLEWCVRSDFVI